VTTKSKTTKSKTTKSKTTKSGETKSAGEIKEITFAGVKLRGNFTEETSGVYIGKGEISLIGIMILSFMPKGT